MALVISGTPEFREGPLSPLFSIPGLSFQGVSRRKTPFGGEQWVLAYESGASNNPEQISPAEEGYNQVPADFAADLQCFGPIYRLTVTAPDVPQGGTIGVHNTYYNVQGNEIQRTLYEHPKAIRLGVAKLIQIRDLVNGAPGALTIAQIKAGLTPQKQIDAQTLYDLLASSDGSKVLNISQYVFQYTKTASRRAVVEIAYGNTDCIYTTAQMISETGPPTGILSAIASAEVDNAPAVPTAGYLYGWLKKAPTVTNSAGNLMQISGEFALEEWSTWEYDTI